MFDLREARHQSWGCDFRDVASNRGMTVCGYINLSNFSGFFLHKPRLWMDCKCFVVGKLHLS